MTWREWKLRSGVPVALAVGTTGDAAIVAEGQRPVNIDADDLANELRALDREVAPRWVWWSNDTAHALLDLGIRPAKCWDLVATHRLLEGGWQSEPARIWAAAHDLDIDHIPAPAPLDLFSDARTDGHPESPVRPDGYLRPDWATGGWAETPRRLRFWVELALDVYRIHDDKIGSARDSAWNARPSHRRLTAQSESSIEVLCAELERTGLPFDRQRGEAIVTRFVGPRPTTLAETQERIAELDARVLRHLPADLPGRDDLDLRSPDQVKSLLRRVGIEVADTRAWRLEHLVEAHPVVPALLEWRRAERIRTTFGFSWIDEHVGVDDRLRGAWSGSDGAAGRMTATAGLHNMPAELRPAIAAEADHVFVRADLGQIEPRVLAAVSGDEALARASKAPDMYAPVAKRLHVDRDTAKVAVLGAMYGQTTGKGAEALAGLEREYPVAMRYLRVADEQAQRGVDLVTYGGRRIRISRGGEMAFSEREQRSRAAARGRFGRNAMVQGAAAEFFKTWAALVRARGQEFQAQIVLCLHDELVVHTPERNGRAVSKLLERCLDEAASRWAPPARQSVRFVADVSVIARWSDAK